MCDHPVRHSHVAGRAHEAGKVAPRCPSILIFSLWGRGSGIPPAVSVPYFEEVITKGDQFALGQLLIVGDGLGKVGARVPGFPCQIHGAVGE